MKILLRCNLNGVECINLIFIDIFYCISKMNINVFIMEYMYINLWFKVKLVYVKSKIVFLLKLYLIKLRDRVIFFL